MNPRQWGLGDQRRLSTRDFPAEVLALVDERQGGRHCVQCRTLGIETPATEPLQIDHKQALSAGGDNHHLNLRWACRAHNCGRGARKIGQALRPTWARRRDFKPRGQVVILRGIPGAGKSTYAQKNLPRAFVVSSDRHFLQPDGSYRFDRSRLPAVHEACLRTFREALAKARSLIVVDKCNLSWEAIRPYAEGARAAEYRVRLVTLLAEPTLCWQRNVHEVPRAKVLELARSLPGLRLPPWLEHETVRTDEGDSSPAVSNVGEHPSCHWPTRGSL